jgi:hypothetical protein
LINARHTIKNSATEPEGKKETVGRWQMANGRKAEKQRAEKQRAEKQRKTRRNEKTQKQNNRATKSGANGFVRYFLFASLLPAFFRFLRSL